MATPNAAADAAANAAANAQFAAVADAVQADMADGQRKIDELNATARELSNNYMSLVARADDDAPVHYRNAVARADDDAPVKYRNAVARADDGPDIEPALDSVERSLQTLDGYLETLKQHLPAHAQCFHELGFEAYKEFKQMLHRGEDALVRAYAPPEAVAGPSPVSDLVRAAVEEVMAES